MKNIAIIGAGGFGREVKMLIDQINLVHKKWNFIGYFDDGKENDLLINGNSVLGSIDDLNKWEENIWIVNAVGHPQTKKQIIERINNSHINYATLIHPQVFISNDEVSIGLGSIICAGVLITCNITIGKHVILNLLCTVGHDTIIGDYSSFMPSVNISGEVIIKDGVYVGTGAKIINQIEIGEFTVIGAGAVVSKSLPAHCTAVGIPAKVIKHNQPL